MKIIQEISDKIDKEIDNAECYALDALRYKEEKPILSETSLRLAKQRLSDINILHAQVVSVIDEYKKDKGEPPEAMKILYDILHRKHIERVAAIKGMLSLYEET